jgi:hypothetical protein
MKIGRHKDLSHTLLEKHNVQAIGPQTPIPLSPAIKFPLLAASALLSLSYQG